MDQSLPARTSAEVDLFNPPSDEAFDELAQLAATICEASIAAIYGLDDLTIKPLASIGLPHHEAHRLRPFYEVAFTTPKDVTVVEDSIRDPRIAGHPDLGLPPRVRFFAGVRLSASDGRPLALLCVADRVPGTLTAGQSLSLSMLGRQVLDQLELRKTVNRARIQSADLANALARAEASDRAKSSFLGNMSHEIRTPLNGVLGMANLLESTRLNDRQRFYAETLRESGEGLLRVLGDVIELSQHESGRTRICPVETSLPLVLRELVGLMKPAAVAKQLILESHVDAALPRVLRFDPLRIRQILTNLIGNALKFTATGHVLLIVRSLTGEGGRPCIRFEITDTGIGIPPDRLATIFDDFSMVDESNARQHQGTGLGLSISRDLVRMMGGELTVSSELGVGSTFAFELDLAPIRRDAARSSHVLVVEDNEVNTIVISSILEENGCTVQCAVDGRQALEMMRLNHFDMVFMDVNMPGMDGVTTTRELRAIEAGETHTPVVAVTASVLPADESRCWEAGMDGFIRKPINDRAIADALAQFLD